MTSKTPLSRLLARELANSNESISQVENLDTKVESGYQEGKISWFFSDHPNASLLAKTAGACLALDEFDFMNEFPSKSFLDCRRFLETIAEKIMPTAQTALDLIRDPKYVSTPLEGLDQVLQGGLRAGHVTELVGQAGTGKSQFCLSMSAKVGAQLEKGVIYIDSERKFPAERLRDLLVQYGGSPADATKVMVIQRELRTCNEIIDILKSVESLTTEKKVGLLIIDSIAAIARLENVPIPERQLLLSKVAGELKLFAETYALPVLVTNQVMSLYSNDQDQSLGASRLVPALGLTWHHGVNVRLLLSSKINEAGGDDRTITTSKSAEAEEIQIPFVIDNRGISSIQEDESGEPDEEDLEAYRQQALREMQEMPEELLAFIKG